MIACYFQKEVSLSHLCNRNRIMHLETFLSCHFRVSFRYLREFYIFIALIHLPRFFDFRFLFHHSIYLFIRDLDKAFTSLPNFTGQVQSERSKEMC